jgi:hypothetical protein
MQKRTKAPNFMIWKLPKNLILKLPFLVAGTLIVGILSAQAVAAAGMDPEADKILRSMSDFMGNLSAFSAKADIDTEIIDQEGQKLQFSSSAEIVLKRPNKLYFSRKGAIAFIDLIFDGKLMTIYGRYLNIYFQKDSPATTDAVIDYLHNVIGVDAPGADLMLSNVYSVLSDGVVSSAHMGMAYVNGVECHYLTFRGPHVDWQLWVKAEGDPLPMKYVITTKWMTGAPQYAVRFRDWDTAPKIEAGQFDFNVPQGVKKLDAINFDNVGTLLIEEGE